MKAHLHRILRSPELITLALLIATLAIGAITSPAFRDLDYILNRGAPLLAVGLLALAMTFVIIAGQIDLSIASGAVLVMVATAMLYRDAGVPMGVLLVLAPLMGVVLGLFNGALITWLRLPSLVVTLGTLALYRGLAMVLIGEQTIARFPSWFVGVDAIRLGGYRLVPLLIFLAFALLAGVTLALTTFGRRVYAIGTNEETARFSAIRVTGVKLAIFAIAGAAMGFAALLRMSIIGNVSYKHFNGDELIAITAVVLGGTSINGGRGGIAGTVLAVLLLLSVSAAMGINNVRAENQLAITGTLLIGSVVVNDLVARTWKPRR